MEEEGVASRYWCHMCSLTVEPVMEAEIKCPLCQSGFIEEMEEEEEEEEEASGSLWAPVLMEIMNGGGVGPAPARRSSTIRSIESVEVNPSRENDVDWQLQEVLRRRRRHSAAVLQIVQGIQAGITSESGDGRRVMVIDPVNRTVVVGPDSVPAGSLGDYFIGPGFEALLQRLAENDPNRYGTPPAKREAVEALGTVTVDEKLQCSVCLEDFEVGSEAKEMPCLHKFHADCLLPWLELHSSCPVCRYEIPADEMKTEAANDGNGEVGNASASSSHGTGNGNRQEEEVGDSDEEEEKDGDEEEEDDVSIPWPFSSLFFSSHGNNPSTDSS